MIGLVVVIALIAIGLQVVSLIDATKPPRCPECAHCRQELNEEKQRQDQVLH